MCSVLGLLRFSFASELSFAYDGDASIASRHRCARLLVSYRPLANLRMVRPGSAHTHGRCAVPSHGDRMDARTQHRNASK